MEAYGEDPHLVGRMAVEFVQGLQGNDPKYLKVVATAKHFAVHSGPESLGHSFDAKVDEEDLAGLASKLLDDDFVSGGELAFFDDREIKAAGVAFDEALDHVVAIKADRDFVAGHARLRDLQKSRADAKLVADVERVFE